MSKEMEKMSLSSSEEQPMEVDETELISDDSEPMEVEEIEVFAAGYFLWLVCSVVCFLFGGIKNNDLVEEKQQIPTKSTTSVEPITKDKKATKTKEVVSEDKTDNTEAFEITEIQDEITDESNGPKKDQGSKNTKTPLECNGEETARSDNDSEESKENNHEDSNEEVEESMEVEEINDMDESMEIDESYPFIDNQRYWRNKRKAEVIHYQTSKKRKLR